MSSEHEAPTAIAVVDPAGKPVACSGGFLQVVGLDAGTTALSTMLAPLMRQGEGRSTWSGPLEQPAGPPLQARAERSGDWVIVEVAEGGAAGAQAAPDAVRRQADLFARLSQAMAHDVRNPLNALAIHAEVLRERLRANDPALYDGLHKHLEAIREQLVRTDQILRRFLTFASPSREGPVLLDLADLAHRAVEVCGYDARRQGVRIESQLSPARVRGEAAQLGELVLKLLVAGIDAADRAEAGPLRLSVGERGQQAFVLVQARCPKPAAAAAESERALSLARPIVDAVRGSLATRATADQLELELVVPAARAAG